MVRRRLRKVASVGLKIASFAKRELEKEAMKAMKSKKARQLAIKAASKMKQEVMRFEKVIKAEIAKEMRKKRKH